ncbi:MAG: NAD(P)/FAD-dependent oxidoreductase [Patescibacteria group bacterium]|nr:NAD(P)/FAD-dependent oxidoreductase [Patescibacteria group bacterium]
MKTTNKQFDVAVIGAGPAGMMAAIRAAKLGASVVLIEKNRLFGKKLLMTGKGRCNITNAKYSDQDFISKLGKNGKFLFSSLNNFGPKDVTTFFKQNGLETKTERGGRVFPVSNNANDVVDVLRNNLQKFNVEIKSGKKIKELSTKDEKIESVNFAKGKICAKNFIICTGGKSYSSTGSTGDGYEWTNKLGHTIIPPSPALVPLVTKGSWAKQLQGLSLKNVQLNVFQDNKKRQSRFGEMLFTHQGISGPIVLDVSKEIGKLLRKGKVLVKIDLKPALDWTKLDKRLQRDLETEAKKDFKNYLPSLLPKKMIDVFIKLSQIKPDKKLHSIDKTERKKIAHLLKELTFEVKELAGFDQAIITSGGVDLREVDSKTMRSRKIENLFFAGEILDLDGPTGGFNLQICWSTGFAAGTNAAEK